MTFEDYAIEDARADERRRVLDEVERRLKDEECDAISEYDGMLTERVVLAADVRRILREMRDAK